MVVELNYFTECRDMLLGTHVLIAGVTGSGKSVLLNDIIYSALALYTPSQAKFCFIDTKRVELVQYKNLPHCDRYATELSEVSDLLQDALYTIDERYIQMSNDGLRRYRGADIYIVIDELADLLTVDKKTFFPMLQRIAQIGRAAGFHLIACTQAPNRRVIPAELSINFTDKIALRCDSPIESRQIIGMTGAEQLPLYGQAIYKSPKGLKVIDVPFLTDEQITERCRIWY